MSTSGSIDFLLTARQVIDYATRKINVLAEGEQADADMAERCRVELNLMLKSWMKYPGLWHTSEGYVNLVNATGSYALTPRPYRVLAVRYRNASDIDLPMYELTKDEYQDMPTKTTAGIPTQWFFDPQRDTSNLYVWPVQAVVTTESLRVTYQRRFEDVDDLNNDLDIAQEHLHTVGMCLAARIADDYGRAGAHIDRIIQRAEAMEEAMMDMDRPEVIRMIPEVRY